MTDRNLPDQPQSDQEAARAAEEAEFMRCERQPSAKQAALVIAAAKLIRSRCSRVNDILLNSHGDADDDSYRLVWVAIHMIESIEYRCRQLRKSAKGSAKTLENEYVNLDFDAIACHAEGVLENLKRALDGGWKPSHGWSQKNRFDAVLESVRAIEALARGLEMEIATEAG